MGAYSNIPLQVMTPIEAQTKAATLGNLLQEHQLRTQQIQEAQMRAQELQVKMQEARQMQQDAATWTDKFFQNNGDFEKTLADPDVQRIHPKLYGQIADQYQQIRDRAAVASKSELLTQNAKHEALGGMLENALALPDDQRSQQWPQLRQDAVNMGYAKPEEVPESDPGRYWLETHKYYGMGAENVLKSEIARRTAKEESNKRAAELPGQQAQSLGHVLDVTGRIAGAMAPVTLGGAAAPVSTAQPAAATATVAGQGAPAGTNVSQNRLNVPTAPTGQYDTKLTPQEETAFQAWKAKYAPNDSGVDYDLRGAFKAGLTPDPQTGHWPDTFKKPNHPTFSDQSQYASAAPDKAGHWDGDTFVPPQAPASTSARSPQWTQEKQDAWDAMRKLVPAGALPFLPPVWSPQAQATAQRLGLSAEQQAVNARERQTGAPKTAAEFAAAMTDPTKTPDERQRWKDALTEFEQSGKRQTANSAAVQNRFDTREFDTWSKKHEDLQEKEQDQWKLAGEYGDALNSPKDTDVYDPGTKKTVPLDDAHQKYFQKQYDAARTKATQLQNQAKGIRQRFKWGEFAPQEGGGVTSAAPAPTAKSWNVGGQTYAEGQIITSKGKQFKVLGVENGKINAQPIQ